MTKKKKTHRKGFKLPGGVGPKAVAMGALGLILAPRIIPVQSPGAQKLAAGLGLRALKVGGGGPLAAVGLMELAAQYGSAMLVGGGLPFFGPANGGMQGGTDY